MAASPRDTWKILLERFDLELPTRPEWHAERAESPANKIIAALERPLSTPPKALLTGTIGTGKSSELLWIAEQRARKGDEFVIVLDLVRHFSRTVGDLDALQTISSWEVCFLSGLALIRAAQDQLGYVFPEEQIKGLAQAWSALAKASQAPSASAPTIDIFSILKSMTLTASKAAAPIAAATGAPMLAGSVVATGLSVLAELAGAGKWLAPIGKKESRRLEDQDELMKTLLDRVNLLFGTFRQYNRRVLLIIDGLDRINDPDRADLIFVHSQMLARLDCPLIVSAPFVFRNDMVVSDIRGFRLQVLHNAPVLSHEDPRAFGPGIGFMTQVFRRRVSDINAENIIPPRLLEKLAYYSGGRVRDFVRTLGMLAERGWDDSAIEATEAQVNDVLTEARRLAETGIDQGHIDVLAAIAKDLKHRLPHGELARYLLRHGRLLPYPNESEWFYPHPLLTISLVQV